VRFATFSSGSGAPPRIGVVASDRVIDFGTLVARQWRGHVPTTLLELIQQGPEARNRARDLCGEAQLKPDSADEHLLKPDPATRWHAPIPRPAKNIFCVGRNYVAHIKEGAAAYKREMKLPEVPVFFTKAPTAVIGPFDDVPRHGSLTEQLDWEAELAVVIGRPGRDISRADAGAHIFGYTVANDITARDLQQRHMQWFKGKSLDGSCPIGPVIVTADEFGDPQNKRVSLRVNGVTKQDGSTADMIFPVDVIIEWLSQGLTLEPGDIIATGTPDGVGMGRVPQEWLQDGDVIETEVEGIGMMRNTVRDL
jgi:2-keto-4-pentenoate hydratase/2-oxohepta-3-ene-1,7-dioic acid hydratase in catechol pathway